ncbi:MAG: hypothetical protein CVT86_07020 [Alphaproteobacteria bacterium HGW-Alphaproteobacteria-8]|nr:MAG: hypothetical protein CVT86_07020 [Alphaproteobacteria bacterium HGW-Alphaproteobacteria-8]
MAWTRIRRPPEAAPAAAEKKFVAESRPVNASASIETTAPICGPPIWKSISTKASRPDGSRATTRKDPPPASVGEPMMKPSPLTGC